MQRGIVSRRCSAESKRGLKKAQTNQRRHGGSGKLTVASSVRMIACQPATILQRIQDGGGQGYSSTNVG